MATNQMSTGGVYAPSSDANRSSNFDVDDDDGLLMYLCEKSSESRTKCYDCISMGRLGTRSQDTSEAGPEESLSRSTEQICSKTFSLPGSSTDGGTQLPGVVRSCRSQENYFELSDMICVDIDIDDNLASSVDALHYRESVASSISDSSGSMDAVEIEAAEESSPVITTPDKRTPERAEDTSAKTSQFTFENPPDSEENQTCSPTPDIGVIITAADYDDPDGKQAEDATQCLDSELQGRMCPKDADRPSAARLAKRLFNLDGFRKSDVSPHLSKKNSFSQLVGEEFLKYFDFSGEHLDVGLRRFLRHLTISGDSQECDRLLGHFSYRYHQCNPTAHQSEDCCHTLVCAMLLLNANLNGQNCSQRKMTLSEFITNLSRLNNGDDFPRDILKSIYLSLKHQPLLYDTSDESDTPASSPANQQPSCTETSVTQSLTSPSSSSRIPSPLATNINNNISSSNSRSQGVKQISGIAAFKKGYVMRKCCVEPDGRKTPLGKRCWKMYYMILRDTALHLYTDENCYKRSTLCTNTIQLQHALATKASDYTKKKHVFRLQTSDLAQYLIQTSDVRECEDWIEAINLIAAFYSPSVYRDDVSASSYRRCFHRNVSPVAMTTTLNLREQIGQHELMVTRYERELAELRKNPPDRTVQARQLQDFCKLESYVKFELKRYKTYVRLLRVKTAAALRETDARLVNTVISELDGVEHRGTLMTSSPGTANRVTSRKTPVPSS